jgi:type VI secretion system protein ImpG
MEPDRNEGTLNEGVRIERGTPLKARLAAGQQTACEFRTGHEITLWPIEVLEAAYHPLSGTVAGTPLPSLPEIVSGRARAALRVRLRTTNGTPFEQLPIERLVFHLSTEQGRESMAFQLLELLAGATLGIVPVSLPGANGRSEPRAHAMLPRDRLRHMGFGEDEALLPVATRASDAHRVFLEYSRFRERFLFLELRGLDEAVRATKGTELELWFLLARSEPALAGRVAREAVALHCTTAVNLFARHADRILLGDHDHEFHVVVDKSRPQDFEVAQVLAVTGHGDGASRPQAFRPMYSVRFGDRHGRGRYFSVRRAPRLLSQREQGEGSRHPDYAGTEVFLSVVDQDHPPFDPELRQLSVEVLCTNRDLPYRMPLPQQGTHMTLAKGAPVASIRVVAGPSSPGPPLAEGEAAWKLIQLLSQRHVENLGPDGRAGAAFFGQLLELHWAADAEKLQAQREGLASVVSRPLARRLVDRSAMSWVRGHEVEITLMNRTFAGGTGYLLAAVFEHWLAEQCAINSFVQTVVRTTQGDELGRWPARSGRSVLP